MDPTKKLAQPDLTVCYSSVEQLKEKMAVGKELTKFTDVNGDTAVKVSDVHFSISASCKDTSKFFFQSASLKFQITTRGCIALL